MFFVKLFMEFTRLDYRKRVKTVSDEDIRNLLKSYVENGTMNSETARNLLDRIFEIIYKENSNERRDKK